MRKLLLIVDNWELLERYEERFSQAFEVECAPFGSDGVRMARENPPDLILLNLNFEDMTIREACLALRSDSLTRDIPIIAAGTPDDHAKPDGWISEPVSLENLEELFEGWKAARRR